MNHVFERVRVVGSLYKVKHSHLRKINYHSTQLIVINAFIDNSENQFRVPPIDLTKC